MLSIYNMYSTEERRFLTILLISCFLFYIGRMVLSETLHYFFMIWNLFLGVIPFLFSRLLTTKKIKSKKQWILPVYALLWLLFFPNSYYMLTDLYHFNIRPGAPQWYDLIFLLTFAWTGIIVGMMSLWDIEKLFNGSILEKRKPMISTFLLFLASFGIYLGRDLRWNSWDFFTNFWHVIVDSLIIFIRPFEYVDAWGLIMTMGVFLNIIYWSFRSFHHDPKKAI